MVENGEGKSLVLDGGYMVMKTGDEGKVMRLVVPMSDSHHMVVENGEG